MGPFAAGAMLLWGGVAAVPILLHLLRRRRSRTVAWGAMRFLQRAVRRAQRFQFWRLLLLALRVLAIWLIAAALARPLLLSGDGAAGSMAAPSVLRVLVLDTSYSMSAPVADESRFELAQRTAVDLCGRPAGGDGFLLMQMDGSPRALIQGVSYQRQDVIAEIHRMRVGRDRADLPATLAVVQGAIADAVTGGWRGSVEVTLLSDLQQLTWDAPLGDILDTADVGPVTYRLIDCAAQSTEPNLVVSELRRDVSSGAADPGGIRLLARLAHRSGDRPITDAMVQLVVDGVPDQSTRISLAPGASRTLAWSVSMGPGRHAVEVRVGTDDAIAIDNIARQIVVVEEQISVALFGPEPIDTRYLEMAAMPGGQGVIDARRFTWDDVARTELGRFDVWVLANPGPPRGEAAERISQHLAQGGGLVWWLGPAWQPGPGFAPSWSAVRVERAGDGGIDPLDYASEIVVPFEPFPGSGLLTLPVFRYWQLELDPGWQTALGIRSAEAEGGVHALVATSDGELLGRQVIVATAPGPGEDDEPWNAAIAWPVFVPLVQEILQWAARDDAADASFLVGQELAGSSPSDQFSDHLVDRDGHRLATRVLRRDDQTVYWSAPAARRPGVYWWASESGQDASDAGGQAPVVAVNVDPAEGDLSRVENVPPPLMLVDPGRVVPAAPAQPVNALPGERGEVHSDAAVVPAAAEFSWCLLLTAVGILLAESAVVRFLEGAF